MNLESVKMVYGQDGDCCDDDYQELIIETYDGGGGAYLVIKTDRWALDNIDEFAEKLREVARLQQRGAVEPVPAN